jgi:hypothetical protein
VTDKKLRVLFQAGLTLRRHENDKKQLEQIRDRIYKTNKDGHRDLHVAQFVQDGLFPVYLGIIMEKGLTTAQCSSEIKDFFDNIEVTSSYVQNTDNVDSVADTVITRVRCNNPHIYVISGSKTAINKCRQIKNKVMQQISGYEYTSHGKNDITEVYFIKKKV